MAITVVTNQKSVLWKLANWVVYRKFIDTENDTAILRVNCFPFRKPRRNSIATRLSFLLKVTWSQIDRTVVIWNMPPTVCFWINTVPITCRIYMKSKVKVNHHNNNNSSVGRLNMIELKAYDNLQSYSRLWVMTCRVATKKWGFQQNVSTCQATGTGFWLVVISIIVGNMVRWGWYQYVYIYIYLFIFIFIFSTVLYKPNL